MAAARYVALNPVRARLVERAEDWRSSSGATHLAGRDEGLVSVAPLLDRCAGGFADPDLNRDGAVGLPDSHTSFLYRVAPGRRVSPFSAKRGRWRGAPDGVWRAGIRR